MAFPVSFTEGSVRLKVNPSVHWARASKSEVSWARQPGPVGYLGDRGKGKCAKAGV